MGVIPPAKRRQENEQVRTMSCEMPLKLQRADVVPSHGRQYFDSRYARLAKSLRSLRPCTCSETPCTGTGRALVCHVTSGLHWEVQGRKPMINGQGQSDGDIVPEKSPNKSQEAEGMEGRLPVKGNELQHPSHWTQSQTEGMPVVLERIRKAVRREKEGKFTSYLPTLPGATSMRHYLRQEPGAAIPLARIRGGGSPQGLSLPRQK